jgi:quinol monooxygenase YgiN
MTITFVNRFTLNGAPEDFERTFTETAEFIRKQPGLLRYTLSRDVGEPNNYVNIALWEDAQSLRAVVAHPEFAAHAQSLRALATSEGAVYTERLSFVGEEAE